MTRSVNPSMTLVHDGKVICMAFGDAETDVSIAKLLTCAWIAGGIWVSFGEMKGAFAIGAIFGDVFAHWTPG